MADNGMLVKTLSGSRLEGACESCIPHSDALSHTLTFGLALQVETLKAPPRLHPLDLTYILTRQTAVPESERERERERI